MEESNIILMEEIKNSLNLLMLYCFSCGFMSCLLIWITWPKKQKTQKSSQDLHCFQCEIEMPVRIKKTEHIAQIAAYIMEKYYIIKEGCPHDTTETRVIESVATCETTAEFCIECSKQLTQPKTEC